MLQGASLNPAPRGAGFLSEPFEKAGTECESYEHVSHGKSRFKVPAG